MQPLEVTVLMYKLKEDIGIQLTKSLHFMLVNPNPEFHTHSGCSKCKNRVCPFENLKPLFSDRQISPECVVNTTEQFQLAGQGLT